MTSKNVAAATVQLERALGKRKASQQVDESLKFLKSERHAETLVC